jgi:2-(1,2-epoxy-1,2-dihydrophenyl)acetyl-CoA isomerase
MSVEPLRVERTDDIVRLTLSRPTVGNAVNLDMARALLAAAIDCDNDPSVRCVVMTGEGRLFCAGGDVVLFQTAGDRLPGVLSELAGTLHLAESRLARMNKPLLVLVNGAAAGAGLSLALLGDVVLVARTASFSAAYGALGLSPDGGLSWLLPRLVGLRKAQDMILAGRRLSGDEAEAWGLITRAVDPDALAAEGEAMAQRLAALSAPAIGAARNLLLESLGSSLETHMEREARAIAALSLSPEAREGIAAFVAKRKPDFRGNTHG